MEVNNADTAVVFIDPQNDVLSEKGANWGVLGASVTENGTVENMVKIFEAAKAKDYLVFISPHYFFPTDYEGWKFNGPLESDEFHTHTFARAGALDLTGFEGSGADWLDRFKPYIEDEKTIVVSPHKVFGPQTNDLVLQLRKRRVQKVILGGMLANMCVESHLRELLEQGFERAHPRLYRTGGSLRCSNTAAILGWSGHSPATGRRDRAGSRLLLICATTPAEWSNRGTPFSLSNVQFSNPSVCCETLAPKRCQFVLLSHYIPCHEFNLGHHLHQSNPPCVIMSKR
jgi:nicotinamidase-related amidase